MERLVGEELKPVKMSKFDIFIFVILISQKP